jgi:hypothetical protein
MKRLGLVFGLILGLSLIPVSFDGASGIHWNRACADGEGCCLNPLAICDVGGEPQHQYENKSWIEILLGCPD